jgi:hypothetical protein
MYIYKIYLYAQVLDLWVAPEARIFPESGYVRDLGKVVSVYRAAYSGKPEFHPLVGVL